MLLKLPTTPKNQNKKSKQNKQAIRRYFRQCPKENVILLLMSSIKPDESMIELPRRNEIKLKINYTIFKTKTKTLSSFCRVPKLLNIFFAKFCPFPFICLECRQFWSWGTEAAGWWSCSTLLMKLVQTLADQGVQTHVVLMKLVQTLGNIPNNRVNQWLLHWNSSCYKCIQIIANLNKFL